MACDHFRPWLGSLLTKIVDAMRVRAGLVFLDEVEVMWCLADNHAGVFAAVVDDLSQSVPRVLLHLELGGIYVLHFYNFCAV